MGSPVEWSEIEEEGGFDRMKDMHTVIPALPGYYVVELWEATTACSKAIGWVETTPIIGWTVTTSLDEDGDV